MTAEATSVAGLRVPRLRATSLGYLTILAFGAALRLFVITHAGEQGSADAIEYAVYAHNLATDGRYEERYVWGGAADGFVFRAFRPPGYPFLRASLERVFGPTDTAALLLNVVCELIALGSIMAIVARRVGPWCAALAGAAFSVYVLWTANLMTESVTMCLYALIAHALLSHLAARRAGALWLGALIMIATFVRPLSATFLPVAVVFTLGLHGLPLRRRLAHALLVAAPLVLAMTAWGLRNQQLFGVFVPLSTNLGLHNGREFGLSWSWFGELRGQGFNEAEINRMFIEREVNRVLTEPRWYVELVVHRFFDLLALQNTAELSRMHQITFAGHPQVFRLITSSRALLWPTYAVGLLGLGLVRPARVRPVTTLLVVFLIAQCAVSRGDVRFMAPVFPWLIIVGAASAAQLAARAARRVRQLLHHEPPTLSPVPRGTHARTS